jgi:large subunit ribosomal protein L4
LAVRQALTVSADKVIIIEDIASKDGKTSEIAKLLAKVGATRNILIIVDQKTAELVRATQNLPKVQLVSAQYVNVFDVLNADCVIFTQAALKVATDWLSDKPAAKTASTADKPKASSSKEAK